NRPADVPKAAPPMTRSAGPPRPLWRRPWLLAGLAALLAGAFLTYRWSLQEGDRREAVSLVQAGRFADAVPVLDRALGRDPDDAHLLRLMVTAKLKGGALLTDVAPYLDRWCRRRPQDAEPWKLRMGLRGELGESGPALADGLHVLELTPDDHEAREQVAELLLINSRF